MELLFMFALGAMIVFNGALIVYFLGNVYIIPQFFPELGRFGFGGSLIFVVLAIFLFLVVFGNRVTQKKRKQAKDQKQNPANLRFGEKAK